MMRQRALHHTLFLMLPLITLSVACGDGPSAHDLSAPDDANYAKPPWAGGGGNDESGAPTAALSGGMSASAQSATVKESSTSLKVEASGYDATIALGGVYDAELCLFEPADADDPVKQSLIDQLSASVTADLTVLIDKSALAAGATSSDNMLSLGRSDGLAQIGRNNDRIGAGFPKLSSTTDNGIRTFTFVAGFGDVRVAQRYDGNGDGKIKANDPVAHLTCPLTIDVTATLDETGG